MGQKLIRLKPVCKDYLWGGTKLRTEFGKESDLAKLAESWELSVHKDGQSIIADGDFAGKTLGEYMQEQGRELLGSRGMTFAKFPILIKLIDAADDLSVQVHPEDAYALEHEGEYGKTEMWYILSCEEGATLYYGLNREITRQELAERVANNTLLEVLNKVAVHPGDVFFIPPGTIHAIGKGIVLCEIQQNSNTTYRVYDYDRRDKDGNPRELHVDKAVAVSQLKPSPAQTGEQNGILASCPYFTVQKVVADGAAAVTVTEESFLGIVTVDGEGTLTLGDEQVKVTKGDTVFVPAMNGEITVNGNCELVVSYV